MSMNLMGDAAEHFRKAVEVFYIFYCLLDAFVFLFLLTILRGSSIHSTGFLGCYRP